MKGTCNRLASLYFKIVYGKTQPTVPGYLRGFYKFGRLVSLQSLGKHVNVIYLFQGEFVKKVMCERRTRYCFSRANCHRNYGNLGEEELLTDSQAL